MAERPSHPNQHPRPKTEYWLAILAAVLVLGLALGVAVAKYATPFPYTGPSPAASSSPKPAASASASPSATPDVTAAWTHYSDPVDKFSLRYPNAWQHRTCLVDGHTTLYLAPTTATLGVCNSGFGGQMSVGAFSGDQRASFKWTTGYGSLTTSDVTVAGVAGIRQSATVTASAGLGPEPGSKLAQYLFYTGGRTYIATYTQGPAYPDTLSDFDLMVGNTLVFAP